jgi:replication-associated recombination protein RarA
MSIINKKEREGKMDYNGLETKNKYIVMQCVSALIKSIRRGIEEDALFWALELDKSGFGDLLWKRIKIHTSEDIGMAEDITAIIRSLYDNWKDEKTEHRFIFTTHAVLLMSRTKKSREVDNALYVLLNKKELLPIPDYAIDKHSIYGRQKGRGEQHWIHEGSKITNSDNIDKYKEKAENLLLESEKK